MRKKLYHYQIGIPQEAIAQSKRGKIRLEYGWHAQQAAMEDRYGLVELPIFLDTNRAKLIEVEVGIDGVVTKCVYRMNLDMKRDLVLVVIPEKGRGFVKTIWINLKSDVHRTLNRSRYDAPLKP